MTKGWVDKHCGCYIDPGTDDNGREHPYVVTCMLHEFAEKAATLMNKMVKDANSDAWAIMEAQNVLDNYGLLEE